MVFDIFRSPISTKRVQEGFIVGECYGVVCAFKISCGNLRPTIYNFLRFVCSVFLFYTGLTEAQWGGALQRVALSCPIESRPHLCQVDYLLGYWV